MDERFAQQLIQAANARADLGGSPIQTSANASQMANLQNLSQLQFSDAATGLAAGAAGGEANRAADKEEAERDAAARIADILAKREEVQQKAAYDKWQSENDPRNYRKEVADDGGYNFYDAAGNPINVQEYAAATNQRISDVLKDSENAKDQEFINDYNDTMKLGQIMTSGSKQDLDKFYKDRPGLKQYMEDNNINNFADYVQRFRDAYSDKFTQAQADSQRARTVTNQFSVNPRENNRFKWPWEK